jgi:hypothetical protein
MQSLAKFMAEPSPRRARRLGWRWVMASGVSALTGEFAASWFWHGPSLAPDWMTVGYFFVIGLIFGTGQSLALRLSAPWLRPAPSLLTHGLWTLTTAAAVVLMGAHFWATSGDTGLMLSAMFPPVALAFMLPGAVFLGCSQWILLRLAGAFRISTPMGGVSWVWATLAGVSLGVVIGFPASIGVEMAADIHSPTIWVPIWFGMLGLAIGVAQSVVALGAAKHGGQPWSDPGH